jgi:membrane protein implicated in regulation of membrane protease activity
MTQLSTQTSRLVRDELKLAQMEMKETAKHAGVGVGLFSAAGLLAVLGLGCVSAAAIAALALALPAWAAALIVGAALFATAAVAAVVGRREVSQASPTPEQTVENVKKDIHEVKDARDEHP